MKLNDLLTEVWTALARPAASYQEILDRVNFRLHNQGLPPVTFGYVSMAIYHLRHADPAYYGWTIPHCKRGPSEDGRLFRVRVNAGGAAISQVQVGAARVGAYGTINHVSTMSEHGAKMMQILTPQMPTPKLQRKARAMVRKMRFIAEEAAEMAEALDEVNWG